MNGATPPPDAKADLTATDIYKKLTERSKERKKIAIRLFRWSLTIIVLGLVLVVWQLKDIGANQSAINIIARLSFTIFVFFICQILLRLYRYNMMTSDFYSACCDAIEMSGQLEATKQDAFEKLVKVLNPDKIILEVPESPKADFGSTKKPEFSF